MSASPEVPSAAAPPLPDDIKDLIAKEYDRPVEEKAERKWVEKNASQLADMPSCKRCTTNGLTTCVLLKTRVSCPNCTRAKIRCSRLDEELFDRVQLQRQDISRPDFDRILVELSVERTQTLKIKIPTPPSMSEPTYYPTGDSASTWSQFNQAQLPVWQPTNPYYPTIIQPPPMSAVDVAYADLQRQKDEAETRAQDLEDRLKTLQQSFGVQSSTLFARDEEIRNLKRKLEETSAESNQKDSERVVQAENNAKALQEELTQIKATDVQVKESILAYQTKQNELVSENQRVFEQLEASIKDRRRLTRENEILAGEKEELATFRATSIQELRLEKDQAVRAAELKTSKKYESKLAGLRKTLAEHEQDQNRRALVVHSTLSSLAVTLADCLRTTNPRERRLSIAHANMEELLKESLKWLPSKPSQLMSLFWGGVKIEGEEEEEEDDGGNERSGPSQHTPPYTPESSSSQHSRKRPRVQ